MTNGPTQAHTTTSAQPQIQAGSLPRATVTHHTAPAMSELTEKLTKLQGWDAYNSRKVDPDLVHARYRTTHIIKHEGGVYSVAPLPDGRFIHSGYQGIGLSFPLSRSNYGRNATWWNQPIATIPKGAYALQRLPNRELVTAGGDGAIHIHSRNDLSWEHVSISASKEALYAVQALPTDDIVSGGQDGVLRIHHIHEEGEVTVEELPRTDPIRCFQAFPDNRIIVGADDGYLRMWRKGDSGTWRCEDYAAHNGPINCLKVIADGTIVTGGVDGTIKIWRSNPYAIHHWRNLKGHTGEVRTLDVLSDLTILSGGSDGTIRVWREKPTPLWHQLMGNTHPFHWSCSVLRGHTSDVMCAAFMHNGSILSGSLDGTMRIWTGR